MKPVDGRLRHFLGHSLDFVVERITVVAVDVAPVLREEIRDDWVKIARQQPRLQIRKGPPSRRMVNLGGSPMPDPISGPGVVRQEFRLLRKNWLGQSFPCSGRLRWCRRTMVGLATQLHG